MVRPPSPADTATARRFDRRHFNATHDVHDTLPVGPSRGTTYCRTWVLLCIELFRTPSYVPYPSFALNSRSASLTSLFYLAIGHGTTLCPLLAVAVLVYNHPRWSRPGERSIQNSINAIDSFPFSFACRRRLKLSLCPVTIPFACCSRPFRRAATHSLTSPSPSLPRASAFPSGLRTCLGSQALPFELTRCGTLRLA